MIFYLLMRNLLAILLIAALSSLALAASAPYGGDGLYSVRSCVNRTCTLYPVAYQSVREIDFRNFPIHLIEQQYKQFLLNNGHYQDELSSLDLTEVHYLPSNSAGTEYVLLVLSEGRGNPHEEWIAQLLRFSKQQWTVDEEFAVDLHNEAHRSFAHAFEDSTKTLAIRFDRLADEHQCGTATGSCTMHFKWDGNSFRPHGN